MKPCVLFVDDETILLRGWRKAVSDLCTVRTADTYELAWSTLQEHTVHVVVADKKLNGRTGPDLLERVRTHFPHIVRVLITGGDFNADDITRARPFFVREKPDIGMRDVIRKTVQEALDEVRRRTDEHPAVPPASATWEQQSTPTARFDTPAPLTEETARRSPLTLGALLAILAAAGCIVGAVAYSAAWVSGAANAATTGHEGRKFAKAHDGADKRISMNSATIRGLADKLSGQIEALRVQVVTLTTQVAALRTLIQTRRHGRRRR